MDQGRGQGRQHMLMVAFMMANGLMTKSMEMASINIWMIPNTMENGKEI